MTSLFAGVAHDRAASLPPRVEALQQISKFAEISEIMRSPDFTQDADPDRRSFIGKSMLFTDGPEHLERKMVFANLFTKQALSYYELKLLEPKIDEVLSEIQTMQRDDGTVRADLVLFVRSALYRISAGVVGVDDVNTPERTDRFRQLLVRVSNGVDAWLAAGNKAEAMNDGRQAIVSIVDEFFRPSLERRRELVRRHHAGEIGIADLPRDALTMVCMSKLEDLSDNEGYSDYIWQEVGFLAVAATSTTVTTLPHVAIEIDKWIEKHPEDGSKIHDVGFLRAAVGESLRLHQTGPVRFRTASRDITLKSGRKVKHGESVALLSPIANREEEVFGADAEEFNPYRKLPSGVQPWGLTFGSGSHMCCGRSLVTSLQNRPNHEAGTEGTMVKMLKRLYEIGMTLDRERPPVKIRHSYIDAFESVPIIFERVRAI